MLLKLSKENKFLKGFKRNLIHTSSKKNQEKILAVNLKSYNDIPGPLGNLIFVKLDSNNHS